MNAEDVDRLMDLLRADGDDEFAHRVLDGVATKRSKEVAESMLNEALEKVRVAEAGTRGHTGRRSIPTSTLDAASCRSDGGRR